MASREELRNAVQAWRIALAKYDAPDLDELPFPEEVSPWRISGRPGAALRRMFPRTARETPVGHVVWSPLALRDRPDPDWAGLSPSYHAWSEIQARGARPPVLVTRHDPSVVAHEMAHAWLSRVQNAIPDVNWQFSRHVPESGPARDLVMQLLEPVRELRVSIPHLGPYARWAYETDPALKVMAAESRQFLHGASRRPPNLLRFLDALGFQEPLAELARFTFSGEWPARPRPQLWSRIVNAFKAASPDFAPALLAGIGAAVLARQLARSRDRRV